MKRLNLRVRVWQAVTERYSGHFPYVAEFIYRSRDRELEVIVHRYPHLPPEKPPNLWMVTCEAVGLSHVRLDAETPREAKREALELVAATAKRSLSLARAAIRKEKHAPPSD